MKSIRSRLISGLAAGIGLLLLVGGAALYFSIRTVLVRDFDAALQTKAQALATLTKQDGNSIELDFADELMPEFQSGTHPSYFQLWLPNGQLLERSPSLGRKDLPQPETKETTPRYWDIALPNGSPGRAVTFTFLPQREEDAEPAPSKQSPLVSIIVAADRHQLDYHLNVIAAATAIAAILMIVGAGALALTVIRNALAPLSRFAADVAKIDAQNLQSRISSHQLPAELEPICNRMNELLSRLERAFTRERQFSADVAHELRTPVAELRTLSEVALKWQAETPESKESFTEALAIAEQLETVISGLLFMARCEGGIEQPRRESIELDLFLADAWRPFATQATNKGLAVDFDLRSAPAIQSDRVILAVIVRNLLSNAVEYTPKHGTIHISALAESDRIVLRISNTATDLSATDIPQLFERFWRKSTVRTSSPRAGIGLSISKAAAELLGASIFAELPTPGTIAITLSLPRSPATLGFPRRNLAYFPPDHGR